MGAALEGWLMWLSCHKGKQSVQRAGGWRVKDEARKALFYR